MKKTVQRYLKIVAFSMAFFTANSQAQSVQVISNPNSGHPLMATTFNNNLYYFVNNLNSANQLAKFDGSSYSPISNPDNAGQYQGVYSTYGSQVYGGNLYFQYTNSSNVYQLAKYDGSSISLISNPDNAGQYQGVQIYAGPQVYGGNLYFQYQNSSGAFQLAKYDGSSITLISNPDNAGSYQGVNFSGAQVYGGKLYFEYTNSSSENQLAKYDGSSISLISNPDNAGQYLGVQVYGAQVYGGNLYFQYQNSSSENQLAKYDGSSISLISNPDNAGQYHGVQVYGAQVYGGNLYLQYINSSSEYQLAKYDGSSISLISNPDNAGTNQGTLISGSPYGGNLYLQYVNSSSEYQLAKYDGSSISLISNPDNAGQYQGSRIYGAQVYGGNLYFQYSNSSSQNQVAKYDGSSISLISNPTNVGSYQGANMSSSFVSGGRLYFTYSDNGADYIAYLTNTNGNTFTYNFSSKKAYRDLGAVLTNVNTSQFNSSQVYSYSNSTWAAYSGVMTPGKGYRILVDGSATPTITTTGSAVLSGNQSPTLTNGQNEFSFIANPYQVPVDFTTVTKSGLYAGYWYLNPKQLVNGYEQYDYYGTNLGSSNIYSGNAASQYVQPGQGFFVCSNTSGTPSLTFTESSKASSHTANVFGVTAPLNRIATGLFKNGSNVDGAVVVFNSNFSNSIAEEDGFKMSNAGENLTFAVAGKDLCANGWSLPTATDELPMHLYNLTANTAYTIKLDASQFDGNGLSAYLQDNVLNSKTLLTGANNEVSFTTGSNATTDANRYSIVFGAGTLPIKSIALTATTLSNNQVSVKWTTVGESNIASYKVERSVNGVSFTELATVNAGASSYSYIDAKLSSGSVVYYRIKIIDNAGAVSYSKVATLTTHHSPLATISVYPNPVVNNTFSLSFVDAGKYTVSLIDKLGKTVYTTTVNHSTSAAPENIALTGKLATGSYTIKATDENGKVSTTQVIIK